MKTICESCKSEVNDSQKFCQHCGSEFDNDKICDSSFIRAVKVTDSYLAGNRRARTGLDVLLGIRGMTRDKALALLAYHGNLSNLSKADKKTLLRYKALREMFTEAEAENIVTALRDRQKSKKKIKAQKIAY